MCVIKIRSQNSPVLYSLLLSWLTLCTLKYSIYITLHYITLHYMGVDDLQLYTADCALQSARMIHPILNFARLMSPGGFSRMTSFSIQTRPKLFFSALASGYWISLWVLMAFQTFLLLRPENGAQTDLPSPTHYINGYFRIIVAFKSHIRVNAWAWRA